MKIAIDLMGNDIDPKSLFESIKSYYKDSNIQFIFIGTEKLKEEKNFSFLKAQNFIRIDENPILAFKKKKNSSIYLGIKLLKTRQVDCFISAGNTGALMSFSKIMLNMLSNISRPSLLVNMPSKQKTLSVLDVGANISFKSKFLIESVFLGYAFQKTKNIKNPKIGLLNIGSEEKKGTSYIQKAYLEIKKLQKKHKFFQFLGNIEGKEVFEKDLDVLVTDGFTGNIFLKTSEGMANLILNKISKYKVSKYKDSSFMDGLKSYLHYAKYPGALLLGVDALIIKCHSYSSKEAFISAINGAIFYLKKDFLNEFKKALPGKV